MGIQAKGESLSRIVGMILILIGLILSFFLDIFVEISPLLIILLILIEVLWFIFSLCLKLERKFCIEHLFQIFLFLVFLSLCLTLIGILLNNLSSNGFIFKITSNLLIIVCWHFCLSLYKKEKVVFLFSGIGYITLSLTYGIKILILKIGGYAVIPLVLIIFGMVIIIISETIMKRKGFLNYA
ncbi:MAG: hypothetical protein ACFFAQ_12510 [Promethearchaeota archaeon]